MAKAAKPRPYWTLYERDGANAPWRIEFGAYDRSDVVAERADRRDHGVRAKDLFIVCTPNTREGQERGAAGLNELAAAARDARAESAARAI